VKCTVYDIGFLRDYKYAIVFARYRDKWILCKHRRRGTWETPGGHIEPSETPLDAARRELFEETGSVEFDIEPLCDYWACDEPHEVERVTWANSAVFFARVRSIGSLPESEIEKINLFALFPENLTYPDIMQKLIPRAVGRVASDVSLGGVAVLVETDRLLLRNLKSEDAADLLGALGDPEVMRYVEPAYDLDKTTAFIKKYGLCSPPSVFALVEKSSQKVIGHVVFHGIGDKEIYELGWILNKGYWGKGYACEISKALLEYGFTELALHKVVAETVDPDKVLRLMRRLGMTLEGVQRRQARRPDGEWADIYWCGILREDWMKQFD